MLYKNCFTLIHLDSAATGALHWLYEAQTKFAELEPELAQVQLDLAKNAAREALDARQAYIEAIAKADGCVHPHRVIFRP